MSRLAGIFAKALRVVSCVSALGMLAACNTSGKDNPVEPLPSQPQLTGEVIGTGSTRVALLVPKSASGNGGATATAFRNAAELAVRDFPNAGIQVAVYDTMGSPAGAQAAVSTALREGASIVLGPVFSAEVAAVAPAARAAGVPVVAFSSDASVAGPGVYLLSFLPSDDIGRIVSYSASQGRESFGALLPASSYGQVVEASFRQAVAAVGGRIVAIERYDLEDASIAAKASAIAALAPQIDALLVPDSGDAVPAVATALTAGGVTRDKTRLLGSGQWDDPRILNSPSLVGGWFPAPARQGFEEFSRKYQAAYGAPPPRNATLAYDATVLAAGLVLKSGGGAVDASLMTNPGGFSGLDGVFRFLPTGLTERRLAVYEVTGAGARVIDPAARSFGGGV